MELEREQESRWLIHIYKSLCSSKAIDFYEIQIQREGTGSHRLLEEEVRTKTTHICRFKNGLKAHGCFIRKMVYSRLTLKWIAVEFRLERLEKLLDIDQLEIVVDERNALLSLKTLTCGSLVYSLDRREVTIQRTSSRNEDHDLFNCVDLRFPKGLCFKHINI